MSRPIISTEKKANFCATFLFHYPGDAASRSHIFIAQILLFCYYVIDYLSIPPRRATAKGDILFFFETLFVCHACLLQDQVNDIFRRSSLALHQGDYRFMCYPDSSGKVTDRFTVHPYPCFQIRVNAPSCVLHSFTTFLRNSSLKKKYSVRIFTPRHTPRAAIMYISPK